MSTTASQHPGEAGLYDLCRALAFSTEETELLVDLTGWNNRGGGLPLSRGFLAPHTTPGGTSTLAKILRRLIGTELLNTAKDDPVRVFGEQLHLSEKRARWVVAILGLQDNLQDEFATMAPEVLWRDIAIPVIAVLIERHKT